MENDKYQENLFKLVEKQEADARDFGFYWESLEQVLEQVRSECLEVGEAWKKGDRSHLEEEVGDLLQAAISLAVYCELDSEKALRQSSRKFQKRFDIVMALAKEDGHCDLHKKPMDVLLRYWDKAKNFD